MGIPSRLVNSCTPAPAWVAVGIILGAEAFVQKEALAQAGGSPVAPGAPVTARAPEAPAEPSAPTAPSPPLGAPAQPGAPAQSSASDVTTPPAGKRPAASADAEPSSDTRLGVITVTAQRRVNSIQNVPIAITAFSKEAIDQQRISTFRDLSGRVPGLLAPLRSTALTTQTYALRGIGEIDTYPEPAVAVYVDDVYLARGVGSLYDTPDLERIEVLRGPQGTLYGRNSAAGAIRFITKEPTSERTAGLNVTLGNFNNTEVRARVSGGILPDDALNGSVSVIRHQRRGWTYSVPLSRRVNDLDIWVVRAKLTSQLGERLSATLSGDVMKDRSTASYYTPLAQPNGVDSGQPADPDLTWSNTIPLNRTTAYGGSFTLKYEISDPLSLKSVTASRGMHGPIYYDNDGVTYIKGDSYAGFDQNYATQELTLTGEYERINFVGGLYYFYEFFHNHRLSQSAGSPENDVGTITHTNNKLNTRSFAAFGQAEIELTGELTGTVGARYTLDQRRFDAFGQQESGVPLVYPLPNDFDPQLFSTLFTPAAMSFVADQPWTNFDAFTPKVGAQLQLASGLLLFAHYARGFKSGGYDLRANTLNGSVTPYQPQTISNYELGYKSALLDNRFTLNLAAYYNQIDDVQVRATSPGSLGNPINLLINAGDAHTYGVELEAAAVPVAGLTLGLAAAYLHTAYDTFTATLPPNVAGRTTLIGLDFPLAPSWQGNLNLAYRVPVPTRGVWRLAADVSYESKRYIDIYNTPELAVRAQSFVNAGLSHSLESADVTLGLAVNNLFDLRRAQAGGYAPTNAGTEPLDYRAFNPPRFINAYVTVGTL
jgi:iron complex outermembrane receptor protein